MGGGFGGRPFLKGKIMNNIFSMDNVVFRTIGKITDLVWVNILTLIFCIPVITAGASLTAMYAVLLKMSRDEEGGLTKTFWRSFRENIKSSTVVWIVAMVVGFIYAVNLNLMRQGIMSEFGIMEKAVAILILGILLFGVMLLLYIFPLLARYDNGLKNTVINAFKLMIAFFPRSVCMVIICLFPIALMCLSNYFFFLWILYGFSFPGYVCCMLLTRIFEKVEGAGEDEQ